MSKKGFEFLPLAINEKTNIKETTRYLKNLIKQLTVNVEIKKANKSKLPQVHVVLKGAMDERLKAMGIKNVADFLFLMQYTGLARYYRVYIDAKPATVWEVVRYDFFKQFAKKEVVRSAVLKIVAKRKVSKQITDLKLANKRLQSQIKSISIPNNLTNIRSSKKAV